MTMNMEYSMHRCTHRNREDVAPDLVEYAARQRFQSSLQRCCYIQHYSASTLETSLGNLSFSLGSMKAFKHKILNKEPKNVAVSHHNCKLKISTYTT